MSEVASAFSGTGNSDPVTFTNKGTNGYCVGTVRVSGTFVGTVQLKRAEPNSDTYDGLVHEFTSPEAYPIEDPETGARYRLECTAYTSGSIDYRLWHDD